MAKVIAKLFREPEDVNQAVTDLRAKGYEVGVIDSGADLETALAESGLSEEALNYYKLGLSLGGTVVKVSTDEAKADEVQKILQGVGAKVGVEKFPMWASSPGFTVASKMSATNPIDAPMSGDFRKY